MPKPDLCKLLALAAFVGSVCVASTLAADPFLHCTTDLSAPRIQPANSPVLLTVHIVNQGDAPVPYSIASGSPYPEACLFKAKVIDAKDEVQEKSIFNDQDIVGSRWDRELPAGQSVDMPAMIIHGLPVGSYTIQVRGGKSVKVTIKDDPDLARKWDEDLVAKIRKGDNFARHVGFLCLYSPEKQPVKQPRQSFIDALLRELSCDDEKEADRIANTLSWTRQLPPRADALIINALRKHLDLAKKRGSAKTSILSSLAAMAATIGTDEALEAVLDVAQTPEVRGVAVSTLGSFKQEKAQKELRLFLKDEDDGLEFRAARSLAERKDPQALETLLVIANDPKSRWRKYSFESLLKYPNDSRVEKVIKSGMEDQDSPDPQVRQFAEIAFRKLKELDPNKKP